MNTVMNADSGEQMDHDIEALFRAMVTAKDGEVFTTSRQVAEVFGKQHHNVLKAIDRLSCSDQFKAVNFNFADFIDKNGDSRRECRMKKDGFMFLVMGFTGKEAARLKELYIRAFNWMVEQLNELSKLRNERDDFERRDAISKANGSKHGQGLARRRVEKQQLSNEQAALLAKLQLVLMLEVA